jgi:hypothetical protein
MLRGQVTLHCSYSVLVSGLHWDLLSRPNLSAVSVTAGTILPYLASRDSRLLRQRLDGDANDEDEDEDKEIMQWFVHGKLKPHVWARLCDSLLCLSCYHHRYWIWASTVALSIVTVILAYMEPIASFW